MVSATFTQVINSIELETDPSFLSSLYMCLTDCMRTILGPVPADNISSFPADYTQSIMTASRNQLQLIAEKRRTRAQRIEQAQQRGIDEEDSEDLALIEEFENFALESMERVLKYFRGNEQAQGLLVAVASVRDLATQAFDDDDESQ